MQLRSHFLFFMLSMVFSPVTVFSQVDSAALLLKKAGPVNPDEGVQSGRYQVRVPGKDEAPVIDEPATPIVPKKRKTRKTASESPVTTVAPAPVKDEKTAEPLSAPSYVDQVKDLVAGRGEPLVAYKEQVHPDDVRLNRIEINIAPGILYYDSKSSFSYRNYRSYSPVAFAGGEIWWTPFIGLYGQYGLTSGADVVENGALNTRVSVTHELIEGGLDFRNFFGMSRKSNSITFGLHYLENKFSVPSDNLFRSRTKSSGVGFHFQGRFPVAPSYSWILGAKMEPRVSHVEYGTALNLQSGSSPESSRMTFIVGGEFKLSREHQMVWTLSGTLERNQFSGLANMVDPETGITPQGTSVTQTMSLLTLGYRWGH
jgi:hypothetical protein